MAQLVPFGAESPSRTAMSQCLMVIKSLYRDTRPEIVQYLGADGDVSHWVHQADSWPPSWCVIRSGGVWTVAFSGTTNAWQWGIHIYGSFARTGWRNNEANGQWLAVWDALKPEIVAVVGERPDRIRFTGHSYGGALAMIAALDFSYDIPANNVELMAFGAPRYMTQGFGGDRPLVWWEVSTVGDPVPVTPPDFTLIGSPASWIGSRPLRWAPDSVIWDKARGRTWLNAIGNDDYDQPPPPELPLGVSTTVLVTHLIDQYYWRLRAWARDNPSPPALADALDRYEEARRNGGEQRIVDELPRVVPGPDLSPVEIPWYYGYDGSLPADEDSDMPLPIPLTGGEAWTITLMINQGIQGYSESVNLYLTGLSTTGADPVAHLENRGIALANLRKKALTEKAQIVGIRYGRRAKGQPSVLNTGTYYGCGPGLVTGIPAQESNAYVFRAYDATGAVRANHYFRGWAQADFLSDPNGNGKGNVLGSKVQALRLDFHNFCIAIHTANRVTSTACIPTYERDDDVNPPYDVIAVSLNDTGRLVVTLNGDLSGPWTVNSYAKLSVPRTGCVRGVSGAWRVLSSTVTGGNRVVTLDRQIRCSAEALVGVIGTLREDVQAFASIDSVVAVASGDKQCGPPFGATRGRRSGR